MTPRTRTRRAEDQDFAAIVFDFIAAHPGPIDPSEILALHRVYLAHLAMLAADAMRGRR
jgi:hypothetical protein